MSRTRWWPQRPRKRSGSALGFKQHLPSRVVRPSGSAPADDSPSGVPRMQLDLQAACASQQEPIGRGISRPYSQRSEGKGRLRQAQEDQGRNGDGVGGIVSACPMPLAGSEMVGTQRNAVALRHQPDIAAQHVLLEGVPGITLSDDDAAMSLVAKPVEPRPKFLDIERFSALRLPVIHNRQIRPFVDVLDLPFEVGRFRDRPQRLLVIDGVRGLLDGVVTRRTAPHSRACA